MRNQLTNIERIERYLRNELSQTEKAAFEAELKTNSTLQEEVRLQKEIMKGLENIALKTKAKKAYKKYTLGKGFKKWGGIAGGTFVVLAASYFAWTYLTSASKNNGPEITYELPELNENGEKVWADADKYLPYQKFTLNAQQDTVIETQDGIVMAVPANAFLGEDGKPVQGEITLEVKEAIEANDILKAGLNTKSGNQLLETGGMFYLNARQNDKSLKIDPAKGVYTEIPTNEIKPGMQLYEGKRLADGTIDWIKPKPLEKFLIPVDISTLNFYPPNYEDTLASLKGQKNKVYKDSLYYSYARLFESETCADTTAKQMPTKHMNEKEEDSSMTKIDTTKSDITSFARSMRQKIKNGRYEYLADPNILQILEKEQIALYGHMRPIATTSGTYAGIVFKLKIEDLSKNEFNVALGKLKTAYPEKTHHIAWKGSYPSNDASSSLGSFEVTVYKKGAQNIVANEISGEWLFKEYCASCHHPTQLKVGPALKGARARWASAGFANEIYNWIKNPATTAKRIPYARNLKSMYDSQGTPIMSAQLLNREEIDAVFEYVENVPPDGINPSRIKTIWNSKFNNTLIATKEFEERLKFIHTTCNEDFLNIYVNNLDKKMCTLDSMAYNASQLPQFLDFALRGDGRVKKGEKHLEKLRKYYEEKTKLYTEAVLKTEKEFRNKNQKEEVSANRSGEKFKEKDKERIAGNFEKELKSNLENAKKQMGMNENVNTPNLAASVNRTVYSVTVVNSGWCNIDRATEAATLARTTLNYTDQTTGKTAVIKYEELTASVTDYKSYDRVFAYLIPDKLDSYMRMPQKGETFAEKLNELMNYQLVVVAYKGMQPYYNLVGNVKPGNYPTLALAQIESSKLDNVLGKLKGESQKQKLVDELAFRFIENKEAARQKKVKDLVEFRDRMQRVIFPCGLREGDVSMVSVADSTAKPL